ncbi:hypothetical protein Ddye_008749 [Dipteronia dyeriana]|uniref:Reverse transcriptase n=1 Tax=Dipteronia dyeriana TaxID=168575 RepID=A0AAD9XAF3_9ROSI|nr:hypothetical protein Ddye_008749 [Dipteronia dyeriana]
MKLTWVYLVSRAEIREGYFTSIVDRVWHKIKGWGEFFLSLVWKEILVKAVIQAIPTYAMSLFKLPKRLIAEIHQLCARYWWGEMRRAGNFIGAPRIGYASLRMWGPMASGILRYSIERS